MPNKDTGLVYPDGRPIKRAVLGQEIAAPTQASIRTIQSGHPAQGLDPARLGRLLRDAEDGDAIAYYELAEEMEEKDLHYLSVLGTRKRAVSQLPIEVEAAGDDEQCMKDKQLVQDWLDRDLLESEFFDILDAIGKGVSSTELIWDMKPDLWLPSRLEWRDPRWFEFDRVNGRELKLRGGESGVGEASSLPPGKFLTHFHPSKSGLPIRSGIARIAAWGYMFKNFAIKDWVTFLEQFGQPLRIGKYGPNESEANKDILHRALHALGSDAAASFPETMSVEFIDRKAGTAPNDLWRSHAEYFDMQISKAVLGQTNTTDAQAGSGIGSGQADVHNEVREDIERADAKLLAATLNRELVPVLVMLNHGPRDKYPRIKIGRPDPVDIKTELESAGTIQDRGVPVDWKEMADRASVPIAETDQNGAAKKSPQKAVQDASGSDAAKPSGRDLLEALKSAYGGDLPAIQSQSSAEPRDLDAIDLTVEEAIGDWEAMTDPLVDRVEALIEDCNDLGELQSRLAEIVEESDVSHLQSVLARGTFASRIAGLADSSTADDGE